MMLVPDPIGLWAGIHLEQKVLCACQEGLRVDQVWKKKLDNWLKISKDPQELS